MSTRFLSRRSLVAGGVAAAATAARAACAGMARADETPASPALPETWDYTCDVLVVG